MNGKSCNHVGVHVIVIYSNLISASFDALEEPLSARSKELEDQVKFYQFNRDVDDELVGCLFHLLIFKAC